MLHPVVRRLGVLTAAATLSLGLLAPAAHADPTPSSTAANSWLAGELLDGVLPGQFGPDYGLSIDYAFSLLEAGDTAGAARIRDAVAANIGDYISGEAFGDAGSTYAGPTAKALVLAQRTGGDPRSFGGVDLVARLEGVTTASGPAAGRLVDTSSFGDFANALGQAFAVEGLTTAGSPLGVAARRYLVGSQCGTGAFRTALAPAGQAPGCPAGATGSVDATSLVVDALSQQVADVASVTAADRAGAWLAGVQRADGSFGSDEAITTSNTNSTGLAAAALGSVCRTAAADRAADFVRTLQLTAQGPAAADAGAVAADQAAYAAAQSGGVADESRDQFRRATAQAATGLAWDDKAPATITLTGPASAVAPLSAQTLTVTGAARGETVCLATPTGTQRLVGTGNPLSIKVGTPATGKATYAATTGPGSATYTLSAAAVAAVKTKKVSVGDKVKVTLSGLGAGSKVVTKIRGTKVDKTRADANGVARVVFKLKAKVAKPGRATLKIKPAGAPAVKKSIRIVRP